MTEFRRHGADDLPSVREMLIGLHRRAYADQMEDMPFHQRFEWFVDSWGSKPGWSCVVAHDADGTPGGFAYGAPLAEGKEWWQRFDWRPDQENSATFGVSELLVIPSWRKTGTAAALHAALLDDRPEGYAILAVDVQHPKVGKLYESWGYFRIGEEQPFADSPMYSIMVKHLGR